MARLAAWRVAQGRRPCSVDTGAYCTARSHLPEAACRQLVRRTGRESEAAAPAEWLWHGRRVRLVDGSTITMPDTAANQAAYPQAKTQRPGCGFPIARIVVVFSLAVGTVLEAALGPYKGKQTGENSLFRTLDKDLLPGDLLVADRYFSGWFDIVLLARRGVDVVLHKHQKRPTDFRTGRRLGREDHVVRWPKPPCPEWLSQQDDAALPEELEIRELRVQVKQKGFRVQSLTVVTTLLDDERYPLKEIADLYRRRWEAELNLRSLKSVLQMDHLRCKTPERVRNEFFLHLLSYNLLRRVMVAAAIAAGVEPRQVSFKGTLQTLAHFLPLAASAVSLEAWYRALLAAIAAHVVGNRPDRVEPRRVKRRPKPYKLLRKPRRDYKK